MKIIHLFTCSLLLIAVAGAQSSETLTANDPEGDVEGAPLGFIDLTEGSIAWNATHVNATLQVADRTFDSQTGLNAAEYIVEWSYGDTLFHLAFMAQNPQVPLLGDIPVWDTELWRLDEEWTRIATLPQVQWDLVGAHALIPFSSMKTEDASFPGPGQSLVFQQAIAVYDTDSVRYHDPATLFDVIQGTDTMTFPADARLTIPGAEGLAIGISTPSPIRFSNGAATTFHWPITISNQGTLEEFTIATTQPESFEVDAPAAIRISPGEEKTMQVFVTTPFRHLHGETEQVHITISSETGNTTYPIGIHYPLIPQPAGHHPTMWFHGAAKSDDEPHTLDGAAWILSLIHI